MLSHKKIYMLLFVTMSCCAVEPGTGLRAQKEARERFFEQLEERAERRDRVDAFNALLHEHFDKQDRAMNLQRRHVILQGSIHVFSCEKCKNGFCDKIAKLMLGLGSSKL